MTVWLRVRTMARVAVAYVPHGVYTGDSSVQI